MVTLKAHFDGKTIVPDEPLSLPPNQKLRVTIESIDSAAAADGPGQDKSQRAWPNYRALAGRLHEQSTPAAEPLTDSVSRMRR